MPTRRQFLIGGGAILGGLTLPSLFGYVWIEPEKAEGRSAGTGVGVVNIVMRSNEMGYDVWFDPVGLFIEAGQTIRWTTAGGAHTTTAYHPRNGNHSLRIPEGANPWDSGYLVNQGDHFEITLKIEGVYDYYCIPHEMAGMVGRIIVGRPTGPGALPFDYYKSRPGTAAWKPVPEEAQKSFPSIEQIMREKIVHRL